MARDRHKPDTKSARSKQDPPANSTDLTSAPIGTLVSLTTARSEATIQGMLSDRWYQDGALHVRIYSYAWRDETEYEIDRARKAHPVAGFGTSAAAADGASATSSSRWSYVGRPIDDDTASPPNAAGRTAAHIRFRRRTFLAAVVSLAILLVLIVPIFQGNVTRLWVAGMSYDSFLERDFSLPELVSVASSRIAYRRDVEDYWSAPGAVWNTRRGDCEDYASVISDYLYHHDVDHVVVSMSLREGLQGHAAVVAFTDEGPRLLDPTRATAPTGYERYAPGTGIRDVLDQYAVLPVEIHAPPISPGRPDPQRVLR